MNKKINALQILRALAAILIVIWHSPLVIKLTEHNYWQVHQTVGLPSFVNHLYFGVDLFFCISGFIMFMLIERLSPNFPESLKFLKSRVIRIAPPYWFFTIFIIMVYLLSRGKFNVGHLTGDLRTDGLRAITSFLLIPQKNAPILGVGWTLIHEFMFYVVCAITILVGVNHRLLEILGALSIVSILLVISNHSIFYGYGFSVYNIEFFFGALAYKLYNKKVQYPAGLILGSLACYLITASILDHAELTRIQYIILRPICGGVVGFLIILGLIGCDKKYSICDTLFGKVLVRLGNASYTMYLLHWSILSCIGKVIGIFHGLSLTTVVFFHISSILLAILISTVFSEKIELPFHRWLSKKLIAHS